MLMPEDVQFEAMRVRTSEYSSEAESYRRWREIHVAQPRWWGRGLYTLGQLMIATGQWLQQRAHSLSSGENQVIMPRSRPVMAPLS